MQAIRKPHTVRKAEILRFWDVNIPCQVSKHTLPFIFRYFAIYVDILFLGYFFSNLCYSLAYPYHTFAKKTKKYGQR